jgi:O-antigen ligase
MLGTIGNPEYLAGWLALGLSVATVVALSRTTASERTRGRDPLKVIAAGVALLNLAAIFISGGRGAILASLGALGLVAAFGWIGSRRTRSQMDQALDRGPVRVSAQRPHRFGWTVGLLAVGLLVLAGLWAIQKPDARERTLPGRLLAMTDLHSPSMRHRIGMLAVTSRIIAEHPLAGAGPGRYGWAFSDTQRRLAEHEADVGFWSLGDVLTGNYVGEAHCDPLQWWAEYGLLPILGLTLMIARALSGSWRALRRRGELNDLGDLGDPLTAALWALIATMSLNMWVAFPLHGPVRALTFWTALGLLAACTRPDEEKS